MVSSFEFFSPVNIFFGDNALSRLLKSADDFAFKNTLIVTEAIFADVARGYVAEKLACDVLSIGADAQLDTVIAVAEYAKKTNAKWLIALGGGSIIDAVKMAAVVASSFQTDSSRVGELTKFDNSKLLVCEKDKIAVYAESIFEGRVAPKAGLSVIAVPTTAGTGSEVTAVAVISRGNEKKTMASPAFLPKYAVVDPMLTHSLPKRQTLITGIDALSHAIEAFWSVKRQPITDLYATVAAKTILENLEAAYENGKNSEARAAMSYGSLMAGLAFAQAKTAGCHACSYPLSENYRLAHGEACAFTLDSFIRINRDERLDGFAKAVGFKNAELLAKKVEQLKELGNLKTSIDQLNGFDFDAVASAAAEHPLMKNNPVKMDKARLKEMFLALDV